MRNAALLILLLVLGCSRDGDNNDKAKPSSAPSAPSAPEPATPGKREMSIKGTLAISGAFTATVSLPPGSAMSCGCITDKNWMVDASYTDGADAFVALRVSSTQGMTMTSGKLSTPSPLHSQGTAGLGGSCKPDNRNADGVIAIDIDGKLTGEPGEVTVKGHLDVVCRSGR